MVSPADLVRQLLDADRPEDAADLLVHHLADLFFTDPRTVGELVAALPPAQVACHPVLRMVTHFIAPLLLQGTPGFTARLATPDSIPFQDLNPDEIDWYLMARLVIHRMRSEFAEAQEVAARARPRLRESAPERMFAMRRMVPSYFVQIGAAELLAGDVDQALADFEEALTVDDSEADATFQHDAAVRIALVHAMAGRLRQAEAALADRHRFPMRAGAYAVRVEARVRLAEALIGIEHGEESAGAALAATDPTVHDELWPLRLLAHARWELARGNPAGVLDRVEDAERRAPIPPGSLAAQVVEACRVDALTLMGAPRTLDAAAPRPAGRDGAPPVSRAASREGATLVALAHARTVLYTAEPTAALRIARRLCAAHGIGPSARAEALLLTAWAGERTGGEPDATVVGAAAALIAGEGLWRVLALVPAGVREACLAAMRPGESEAMPAWIASARVPEPRTVPALTRREREVLRGLASSNSLPEIATSLHVSVNTVKTQVRSIYRRFGVGGRAEVVAMAAAQGLLDD